MKRCSLVGLLMLAGAVSMLAGCSGFRDRDFQSHEKVILPAGEVHEGWYFAAGNEVIIAGTVKGDAYVAGGMVQVDGTVEGDLIAAGGSVIISGKVLDDVRAAGGVVDVNGSVGKNVSVAGGTLRVGKTGTIGGGLLAGGGTVMVGGSVQREVLVGAGEMTVTGKIGGNLRYGGDYLTILEGAKVDGNVRALVGDTSHVQIASGTVAGEVKVSREVKAPEKAAGPAFAIVGKIIWILALLATTLVVVLLFPGVVNGVGSTILKHPGMSLLWGLLFLVVTPLAVVLLLITVIGIPIALLLLTAYLWLLYLAQLTFGILLGQFVFKNAGKTGWALYWPLAVALIVVELVAMIPILGVLVRLAAILFGTGAVLMVWRDLWKRPAI